MSSRASWCWLVPLVLCSGCAAFVGYAPQVPRPPLPDELRSRVALIDASVDLGAAATPNGAGGVASPRRASLPEVLGIARERANIVLEAAAQLEAASGRVQSADGALWPGVRLEAGGSHLDGRQVGSFGELREVSFARFEPGASVFYRVNPGAAVARSAGLRHEADAAGFEVREAERTAMLQAGLAHLDLALAYASYRIAERLVADAKRFLGITQARAVAEIGAGAEVARAEAELARARQTAIRARGRWEQASVRLAVLLRWDPAELLVPADTELRPTSLIDPAGGARLYQEAQAARPDLGAAQARSEAASSRVAAAWWELFGPEIDASLGERLIGTEIDDLGNTTLARVFLALSFDLGKLGRARAARGEARAAEIRDQALREQIRGQIEAAVSKVRTAGAAVPEARAGAQAAERSSRAQLARFEAGTGLGLEVIEAQNAQARAGLELAEAIVRHNIAQIELAASIGHLAPELIAP